jgi:hypothetical protein
MSTKVQNPAVPPNRFPQARLWFGVVAGAVAFTIQEFACFQIAIQACKDEHLGAWGPLDPAGVRWVLGGISMFMLLITIWGGIVSYRNWRAMSEQRRLLRAEGKNRESYMALFGLFANISFAIGIIWAGIPMAILNTCVAGG